MWFHQLEKLDDAFNDQQDTDSLDAFRPDKDGLYSLKLLDKLRTNNNNYDRPSSPNSTMEDIDGTSFHNFMFGGGYSAAEKECQQHFIPLPLLGEQNHRTKPKLPNPNPKRVKTQHQHCVIRGRDELVKRFEDHCMKSDVTPSSIYEKRIDLPPFMASLENHPNLLKLYKTASELPHPSSNDNDKQTKRNGRETDNTIMPTTDKDYAFGDLVDLNGVIISMKRTPVENNGYIYIMELLLGYVVAFKEKLGSAYDERVPLLVSVIEIKDACICFVCF